MPQLIYHASRPVGRAFLGKTRGLCTFPKNQCRFRISPLTCNDEAGVFETFLMAMARHYEASSLLE